MDRLLSKKNIFLSIYLVDSYIENKELLDFKDRRLLMELKDVFNKRIIKSTIDKVETRIKQILDNDNEFFPVKVYFKPKKYENGHMIFRPLHTASLIDQIAMVAMFQVLVYDIGQGGKLIPSELSRLLPSNFYGNRISYNGSQLFKPWQDQYQEYISKANEMLFNYCETSEYKYEVSLDLENFFPSINPQVLYIFLLSHLPLKLNDEDKETIKKIIRKLLIFRLCDLSDKELEWYLLDIDRTDYNMLRMKGRYAKGLPQGLPHSYFMANIFMLLIRDKYSEVFPGEMLFYVDDSVIFTNGLNDYIDINLFEEAILALNKNIEKMVSDFLSNSNGVDNILLPLDYYYKKDDYKLKVHDKVHDPDSKSVFAAIADARNNSGEMYLKGLSRETSNIIFDMFTTYSDEEVEMIRSRTDAILNAIDEEIKRINDGSKKVYLEKLIRYKKFFRYRKTILDYKCTGNVEELKNIIISDINISDRQEDWDNFFNKYKNDILDTLIQFVFKRCTEEAVGINDLKKAVKNLIKIIYGDYQEHSYLFKAYEPYLKKKSVYNSIDIYTSLYKVIVPKFQKIREQSNERKYNVINDNIIVCCTEDYKKLYKILNLLDVYNYSEYIRSNSSNLERMILNALFSYIFEFEFDDSFTFAKKSRTSILYSEIRTLAMLRNRRFETAKFVEKYKEFTQDDYMITVDYSLLQVMEIFKTFVVLPERIDNLILIHKYCSDTWKNGSKYLHFYTLHNQEHAVSLIRSSIRLLHAISYFKLKQIDYFILFAACYLHDISMVSIPDINKFYINNDEHSNSIYSDFINDLDIDDIIKTKKALCEAYQQIDEYFETNIRSNHASNSAMEIRNFKELDFIEPTMRELIAEVSAGHCYNTEDIYYTKSLGKSSLVNEKFVKILLRISDLLDMSRYRISKVILNHNLENLNKVSRFHWISHLITDGYELNSKYYFIKKQKHNANDTFLKRGEIVEKIQLNVNVLMSQTTGVKKKNCKHISHTSFTSELDGEVAVKITCDKDSSCKNSDSECNFLCKWFVTKNDYLFEELAYLKNYLNNINDNFFASDIDVNIKVIANTDIPNDVFDYLREYVEEVKR